MTAPTPAVRRLADLTARYVATGGNWVTVILGGLAEALAPQFPGYVLSARGPFGLACRACLFVHRADAPDTASVGALVFEPGDLAVGEIRLVDTTSTTGTYAPGTLGAFNGLNHPTGPVPDALEEIAALLRATIEAPDAQP